MLERPNNLDQPSYKQNGQPHNNDAHYQQAHARTVYDLDTNASHDTESQFVIRLTERGTYLMRRVREGHTRSAYEEAAMRGLDLKGTQTFVGWTQESDSRPYVTAACACGCGQYVTSVYGGSSTAALTWSSASSDCDPLYEVELSETELEVMFHELIDVEKCATSP